MYASRRSKGIKTGDAGSLEVWLGSEDRGFGEDGSLWAGKDMGQSGWESLVKDNFYIPVQKKHILPPPTLLPLSPPLIHIIFGIYQATLAATRVTLYF